MPITRTLTPATTGRIKFATSTAPRPPLADLVSNPITHQDNSRAKGRRRLSRRSGAEADEPPGANSPNGQHRLRRKRLAVVGFLVARQHF